MRHNFRKDEDVIRSDRDVVLQKDTENASNEDINQSMKPLKDNEKTVIEEIGSQKK